MVSANLSRLFLSQVEQVPRGAGAAREERKEKLSGLTQMGTESSILALPRKGRPRVPEPCIVFLLGDDGAPWGVHMHMEVHPGARGCAHRTLGRAAATGLSCSLCGRDRCCPESRAPGWKPRQNASSNRCRDRTEERLGLTQQCRRVGMRASSLPCLGFRMEPRGCPEGGRPCPSSTSQSQGRVMPWARVGTGVLTDSTILLSRW